MGLEQGNREYLMFHPGKYLDIIIVPVLEKPLHLLLDIYVLHYQWVPLTLRQQRGRRSPFQLSQLSPSQGQARGGGDYTQGHKISNSCYSLQVFKWIQITHM